MMSAALMSAMSFLCAGMSVIAGRVTDASGQPIAGSRVFMEPGIGGVLREAIPTADGTFRFDNVPAEGVGVFAIAPGHGFGGTHLNVTVADEILNVSIALRQADSITGRITNHKGAALAGARITRIAVLDDSKVGIPLAKLTAFGYEEPVTNDRGQFTIPNLPRGAKVAIKAGHPQYAQEAISEVSVGESNLRITMDPGVLVNGNALSRDGKSPVTGASILFRSTQPPHDTVITTTDYQGAFMVRLKPGEYLYQAAGIGRLSPGWERLEVTAAREVPPLRLTVAATGVVHGVVRGAVSGAPIQGARLEIESNGSKAALLRTGPSGAFRATIAEGESLIRLESPPGYLPPTDPATRFHVAGGAEMELPGMWLRPIPTFMLHVLDEDGDTPRPGAVITLLRPRQFGWRVADAMGLVEIRVANLPEDRRIIGIVEDPREPLGALFALHLDDVQGARVQLLRLASVRGRVVNARGRGLEGLLVGGIFPGELIDHDLLLWQRLTGKDGHFSWESIVPGTPQRCVAIASDNTSTESMILNPAPGEAQDVGNVVLRDGKSASSLVGKPLRWRDLPQLGGPSVDRRASENRPAMVVYCDEEQAEIVLEGLGVISDILGNPNLQIVLVVNGRFAPRETPIPVFNGVPPNAATTFLLDASGRAVLETIGLPPLTALRKLQSETMP